MAGTEEDPTSSSSPPTQIQPCVKSARNTYTTNQLYSVKVEFISDVNNNHQSLDWLVGGIPRVFGVIQSSQRVTIKIGWDILTGSVWGFGSNTCAHECSLAASIHFFAGHSGDPCDILYVFCRKYMLAAILGISQQLMSVISQLP